MVYATGRNNSRPVLRGQEPVVGWLEVASLGTKENPCRGCCLFLMLFVMSEGLKETIFKGLWLEAEVVINKIIKIVLEVNFIVSLKSLLAL